MAGGIYFLLKGGVLLHIGVFTPTAHGDFWETLYVETMVMNVPALPRKVTKDHRPRPKGSLPLAIMWEYRLSTMARESVGAL